MGHNIYSSNLYQLCSGGEYDSHNHNMSAIRVNQQPINSQYGHYSIPNNGVSFGNKYSG